MNPSKHRVGAALLVPAAALLLAACRTATASPQPSPEDAPTETARLAAPTKAAPFSPSPVPTIDVQFATVTSEAPGLEFAAGPAEVGYLLPLTVQYIGEESLSAFFELERPAAGVLSVLPLAPGLSGAQQIELDATRSDHWVNVAGLEPGGAYSIQVGLRNPQGEVQAPFFTGEAWDPVSVETIEAGEPYRIAVFGDSGFGGPVTRELAELIAAYGPQAVIHTGDLVYKVYEEPSPAAAFQRKLYAPLSAILQQVAFLPVPGNHEFDVDARWEGEPYYFHAFPPLIGAAADSLEMLGPADRRGWYAWAAGQVQFLFLNSQALFGAGGRAEQTAWLAERLQDPTYRASILITHVPFESSGRHARDGRFLRQAWGPLLDGTNTLLILSGHDHDYERLMYGDRIQIISGGGSGVLYTQAAPSPPDGVFARRSHFLLLDLLPDEMSIRAIALDGSLLDEISIRLP